MTTATDWDDATWTDTGSHAVVTDVATVDGAASDGKHTVDVHAMADKLARVQRRADMLAAENVELRRRLGGWEPRRDPDSITGAADLTERQQRAALVAPTAEDLAETDGEGMPLTPIAAQAIWRPWLGEIHHADATWERSVGNLRLWADAYAAPPIERTVVQPVAVDYSYRNTDAWTYAEMVVGQSRQQSVYAELAPERIQADVPMIETSGHEPPPQDLTPAERAIVDDATKRRKALAQAAHGKRAELPAPEPEGTVRASRWARLAAWFGGAA